MRAQIVLTFAILIFLVSALPVSAFTQPEDPLKYADELIAAQRYDEALQYLKEIYVAYPERATEIFQKIQQVMQLRDAYNAKAAALIDELVTNPADMESKLKLIAELEALEANPNPATKAFILETKLTALFTYNWNLLERIFEEGRALIDAGEWVQAARTFAGGYPLYRPEFDQRGYPPEITAPVASALAEAEEAIAAFPVVLEALAAAMKDVERSAASGDGAAIAAAAARAGAAVNAYSAVRTRALRAGRNLVAAWDLVKKIDGSASDQGNFVPFAYMFTLGRTGSGRFEGVLGSMDAAWVKLLEDAGKACLAALEASWSAADAAWDSGDRAAAERAFLAASAIADATMPALGWWAFLARTDIIEGYSAWVVQAIAAREAEYATLSHAGRLAIETASLARALATLESRFARVAADAADPAAATRLRTELRASRAELAALETRAKALAALRAAAATAGLVGEASAARERVRDERARRATAFGLEAETALVARVAELEVAAMENAQAADLSRVEAAKPLVDGVGAEDPAFSGTLVKRPVEATTALQAVSKAIRDRKAAADALAARLGSESPGIADDPRVTALAARARELSSAATGALAACDDYLARAAALKRQSDSARLEADLRMREAREALARGDFDLARERLERARARYVEALGFAEDEKLRADSDTAVAALGADIVRLENEQVVRDTLRLVAAGKNAYYAGDLAAAERNFIAAQARWKKTHSEPEPEVENWLKLITTALSFKTGKEVLPSDPLYPEISARLSAAKEAFAKGQDFLKQSRKVDAIAAFRVAESLLREVLLVFPFHQEANILLVRIDLVLDPAASRDKLSRMFQTARAKVDSGNAQEGYSELLTIQGIDPAWPGLRAAIEAAEIKLGLRLPPPDPAAIREAERLASLAQAIVDSNARSRFEEALAQVNEALRLNPNNARALALKPRILGAIGAPEAITLPAAAEVLYNEALQLYQQGQYPLAKQKLNQLFERFPQARTVQKCIELAKKIDARL